MSRNKGREIHKKLVSISPFTNSIIKDYAVYYKTTDSVIVEDSVMNYFFQGVDVPIVEILKKELYKGDNLNNTFCELFKYILRKKPEFVPNLARLLEEMQNESYENVCLEDEMKRQLFETFDRTAERTANEEAQKKWQSLKENTEKYPDTFSIPELYEYFSDNAGYMNKNSVEKLVEVLLKAYPCQNCIENRTRLIEGLINILTGEEL